MASAPAYLTSRWYAISCAFRRLNGCLASHPLRRLALGSHAPFTLLLALPLGCNAVRAVLYRRSYRGLSPLHLLLVYSPKITVSGVANTVVFWFELQVAPPNLPVLVPSNILPCPALKSALVLCWDIFSC